MSPHPTAPRLPLTQNAVLYLDSVFGPENIYSVAMVRTSKSVRAHVRAVTRTDLCTCFDMHKLILASYCLCKSDNCYWGKMPEQVRKCLEAYAQNGKQCCFVWWLFFYWLSLWSHAHRFWLIVFVFRQMRWSCSIESLYLITSNVCVIAVYAVSDKVKLDAQLSFWQLWLHTHTRAHTHTHTHTHTHAQTLSFIFVVMCSYTNTIKGYSLLPYQTCTFEPFKCSQINLDLKSSEVFSPFKNNVSGSVQI